MHASIATPGLTANQHTGNGRDHLHMVERPDVHIIFPSWCSSDDSLSHIIQHMNYTQVPNFDKSEVKCKQPYSGHEVRLPILFLTMITVIKYANYMATGDLNIDVSF